MENLIEEWNESGVLRMLLLLILPNLRLFEDFSFTTIPGCWLRSASDVPDSRFYV